jgi:hypothetical protein
VQQVQHAGIVGQHIRPELPDPAGLCGGEQLLEQDDTDTLRAPPGGAPRSHGSGRSMAVARMRAGVGRQWNVG